MNNHTPGPWRMDESHRLVEAHNGAVAIAMLNLAVSADTAGANARLIAAAPDLLAALERARPIVGAVAQQASLYAAKVLAEIDAALAKVEGQS